MRTYFAFILIVVLFILCTGGAVYAETRTGYVSDMLILTFRQGPGPSHPVLKTLESNTPLKILDEENGYFNVQLSSGETGWVDKQFVMFDPPKTMIIEQMEQEIQVLQKKMQDLTAASEALKSRLTSETASGNEAAASLKAALEEAQKKNNLLTEQLDASQKQYAALAASAKDVAGIMEKNKTLEAQNNQLSRDIAQLEEQSGRVFKTGMIKWFLAGFGVIFFGWLLGQSVSSRKKKKNSLLS